MAAWKHNNEYQLNILETPEQMTWIENLQRKIWSGDDTEIVPGHLLLTAVHNGGFVIGAFKNEKDRLGLGWDNTSHNLEKNLVGFVFSFPGFKKSQEKIKLKHCSHLLAVLPHYENYGIGFALKRAQWQMVRHQNIDWITWTYDPLLSRNAYLNIHRLGSVCNLYLPDHYGVLHDELNKGQSSDRFQVDWWLNSARVERRLGKKPRKKLDLAHFLAADVKILNPTQLNPVGLSQPPSTLSTPLYQVVDQVLLVEIPSNFYQIKTADPTLGKAWRDHTREIFSTLFANGYMVTDFIHLPGSYPRSFYVISHGESTL